MDCWDAIVVQRADGGSVTSGDVIFQLQAHSHWPFIRNRVREALAWMYNSGYGHLDDEGNEVVDYEGHSKQTVPDHVNILFNYIQPHGIVEDEDCHQMRILLWVEGEGGVDAEQFWKYGPH